MRRPIQVASVALLLGFSSIASAEPGSNCPPGAWFCADINLPNAPGANAPKGVDAPKESPKETPKDAPKEAPKDAPKDTAQDAPKQLAPGAARGDHKRLDDTTPNTDEAPAVAPPREAPPPPVVVVRPAPRPYHEPVPAVRRRPVDQSEWGFNMHLLGAMMGGKNDKANDSGMGGLGFILRARPTGHFAIDFGLDFVSGTDYQGYRRSEVPFTINALLFVNPRDKAQFYLLGGIGWSTAQVQLNPGQNRTEYDYFGFQFGGGFEFRVAKKIALNLDLIGFVRGRTDDGAHNNPEFVDPNTGRSTNTSGGGLLRGGMTIYW
ncbi:MAG: outer membrane beta-barrel protein [Polyangiaceae bacterium]